MMTMKRLVFSTFITLSMALAFVRISQKPQLSYPSRNLNQPARIGTKQQLKHQNKRNETLMWRHSERHHQNATKAHHENNKKNTPKVLYTVFAGRKNRMILQEPYWEEMYRIGAINEVHLWNYTHNFKNETSINNAYLLHLERKYSHFLRIMQPSDVTMEETYWFDQNHSLKHDAIDHFGQGRATFRLPGTTRGYTEYYKYYATHPYDGVIIKADDDIVWINSTQVRPFAQYLWKHEEIFLLSASVVNQGLCGHYQQKYGNAIPPSLMDMPLPGNGMGPIHNNATQALTLHRHFLKSPDNRRKFYITDPVFQRFTYTININFVAMRGSDVYKAFEVIQDQLREQQRYYDEGAITWHAIRTRNYVEGIYLPLVVAHSNFGRQRGELHDILSAYAEYAKTERADFYKGILDDYEAPPNEIVGKRKPRVVS